jgi:hypothetical protein
MTYQWLINKQGELFFHNPIAPGGWSKQNTVQKITDFAIGPSNEIWIIGEINPLRKMEVFIGCLAPEIALVVMGLVPQ